MTDLLLREGEWDVVDLSSAGWRYLSFHVERLADGDEAMRRRAGEEVAIVPLGGRCAVESEGQTWELGGRATVFDTAARTSFFAAIAKRLRPGGTLAWADLAWDTAAADYPAMLRLWMQTMSGAGLDADALEHVRAAYARDVAILPPDRVAELVAQAGFEAPLRFHQAGMIHGWCARRG